jgi:pimeloyl-ACP methyl ester carboxylesterase
MMWHRSDRRTQDDVTKTSPCKHDTTTATTTTTTPPVAVLNHVLLHRAAFAHGSRGELYRVEDELRRSQALDSTLRFVNLSSSSTPLQVRCDVVGQRSAGTLFHIPGAGCSWIYNAVPLWRLPALLPGVQVCSFSRQGLPFTDGAADNATDEAVVALVDQVVELIERVAEPTQPLWLSGHSYGGLQAVLVAHRLLVDRRQRAPAALVLLDAAPLFGAAPSLQTAWLDAVERLSRLSIVLRVMAALGVVRLFASAMLAVAAPTALEFVPTEYHGAYWHALASPTTYAALTADFRRYEPTANHLLRLVANSNRSTLLGDVRLEMLQASANRFRVGASEDVLKLLVAHDTQSVYPSLSTRSRVQTIDDADHQFVSTPRVVDDMLASLVEIVNTS